MNPSFLDPRKKIVSINVVTTCCLKFENLCLPFFKTDIAYREKEIYSKSLDPFSQSIHLYFPFSLLKFVLRYCYNLKSYMFFTCKTKHSHSIRYIIKEISRKQFVNAAVIVSLLSHKLTSGFFSVQLIFFSTANYLLSYLLQIKFYDLPN